MSANGYLAPAELTLVQGTDMFLRNDAAVAFEALRAFGASQGVNVSIISFPTNNGAGAYRPWWVQVDMRAHPALYHIGTGFGLPGLPSQHGYGTCFDAAFNVAWLVQHGPAYGFTRPLATTDPNHFMFTPGTATASLNQSLIGDDVSFTDPISKSTSAAQNTAADFLIYARQDAGKAASILEGAEAITHSALPGQNSLVDYLIYTREDVAAMRASLAALSAAVQTLAAPAGVDGEALAALIASKVDAALADNFAAIPAAPTKFVAAP